MTGPHALAIGAVLAAALLAVTSAGAAGGERKLIAEASANALRVEVTALKVVGPNGEPPTATVRVVGPGSVPHLRAQSDELMVTIAGDLTRNELLDAANSLRR